jgi:vanillate/3-O-methylgallate O-demethylase
MLGDRVVGLSMFTGYSHNDRCGLSLGVVDADIDLGTEIKLVWGEENGGTAKPTVERHRQAEVRVKVAPAPYSRDARTSYHAGWRTRQR